MRRKTTLGVVTAVLVLSIVPMTALAENGAPNGNHFLLNIVGVAEGKTADMDNGGGTIFVWLNGYSQIKLFEAPAGESYEVLDKNGTDSDGASLQLPDPGLDPYVVGGDMTGVDTTSDYSVWVRPLGTPGGFANITTCADVLESALAKFLSAKDINILNRAGHFGGVASVESVGQDITLRTNGKNGKTTFTDVTAQLLTIVLKVEVDLDGDGTFDYTIYVRVPIFNDMLENEYWEYDNHGLKLLQVRFYPIGSDVSNADDDLSPL